MATDPEMARIFRWMAAEEQGHVKWFEHFHDETPLSPEYQELEIMGKNLLQEMIAKETFSLNQQSLQQAGTITELITQAIAFEEDTVLFYEFLRGLIEESETIRHLDEIIAEERNHILTLHKMLPKP
jgi:rubrerythrin